MSITESKRRKAMGVDKVDKDACHHDKMGNKYLDNFEEDKASKHYKKSLRIRRKKYGKINPDVARSYDSIATICYNKGEYQEAIKNYQKSIDIKLELFGGDHAEELSETYNNMGSAYCNIKQYDKALECHGKVLQMEQERAVVAVADENDDDDDLTMSCSEDHREALAFAYGNMAVDFFMQKDYTNAVQYQQKCMDILQEDFGSEDYYTQRATENMVKMRAAFDETLNNDHDQ